MKNIIENRDHRKLGKELDLYSFSEEVGAGLVSFHPNGSVIRYELERFSQKAHLQNGYETAMKGFILLISVRQVCGKLPGIWISLRKICMHR